MKCCIISGRNVYLQKVVHNMKEEKFRLEEDSDRSRAAKFDLSGKPVRCSKCGGELSYKSHGEYVCEVCGYTERDDFGKVRHYIDENGATPAAIISENTGVPIAKINQFLRQGRVEIPDGSDVYIKCEKCGCDIRYGRFCPACALAMGKQIQGALDMGEIPKKKSGNRGKMHFLDSERHRD